MCGQLERDFFDCFVFVLNFFFGGYATGNYDDDYYEGYAYTQGRQKTALHVNADIDVAADLATQLAGANANARTLPQANWASMSNDVHASAGTPRAPNPAGHMAVASWDELKHAGWNEPANRYRTLTDFYINQFAPVPNSPSDLASLKVFHARYHQAEQQAQAAQATQTQQGKSVPETAVEQE